MAVAFPAPGTRPDSSNTKTLASLSSIIIDKAKKAGIPNIIFDGHSIQMFFNLSKNAITLFFHLLSAHRGGKDKGTTIHVLFPSEAPETSLQDLRYPVDLTLGASKYSTISLACQHKGGSPTDLDQEVRHLLDLPARACNFTITIHRLSNAGPLTLRGHPAHPTCIPPTCPILDIRAIQVKTTLRQVHAIAFPTLPEELHESAEAQRLTANQICDVMLSPIFRAIRQNNDAEISFKNNFTHFSLRGATLYGRDSLTKSRPVIPNQLLLQEMFKAHTQDTPHRGRQPTLEAFHKSFFHKNGITSSH